MSSPPTRSELVAALSTASSHLSIDPGGVSAAVCLRRERAAAAAHRLRWLFLLLIVAALASAAWQIFRRGRRDKIEAALVAGLFAVLVHSTVDFGLETLGVLLPFAAVLGMVLGRLRPPRSNRSVRAGRCGHLSRWRGWPARGCIFGIVSIAHASYDDFDALLREPSTAAAQRGSS